MSEWTEQMIRNAASWQAFKAGRALLEQSRVEVIKKQPRGVKGRLRQGKKLIAVSVTVNSSTHIEARCSCPKNQATGEVCEHAVAVCLAAVAGAGQSEKVAKVAPMQPGEPDVVVSYQVHLQGDWVKAFQRGKLSVSLVRRDGEAGDSADQKLCAWLRLQSLKLVAKHQLHLAGHQSVEFLEMLSTHTKVTAGDDSGSLDIVLGRRIELADQQPVAGQLTLAADSQQGEWFEVSGAYWQITANELARLGEGGIPDSIRPLCEGLVVNQPLHLAMDRFLEWLPDLQAWLHFPEDGWVESLSFVSALPAFRLRLDGGPGQIEAQLIVAYGDSNEVPVGCGRVDGLPHLVGVRCEVRDELAEQRAMALMMRCGFECSDVETSKWRVVGEPNVTSFLVNSLDGLRRSWELVESERFSRLVASIAVVRPSIQLVDESGDGALFDLKFQTTDGFELSAPDVQAMLRSGGGSKRIQGRRVVLAQQETELVASLLSDLELEQADGFYHASNLAAEVLLEINKNKDKSQTDNGIHCEEICLPASFVGDLRAYQTQGFSWLADRLNRFGGALLADDMGLGKTVQTIALIERLFELGGGHGQAVLVVVTTSLLGNWRAEFERFAPGRRVLTFHGSDRDSLRDQVGDGDVILTSYGTLARDLAWHMRQEYRGVVVDEASLMRNPDTDHAKAVSKLKSGARLALTGTPLENGVRDLWSIFRFVQPGWLGLRAEFMDRYGIQSNELPDARSMERLRLKMSPFILRRTKEEAAPDLPSKLLIDEFCELSRDQMDVYQKLLIEGRRQVDAMEGAGQTGAARMQMLTALLRLRQTCCDLVLLGDQKLRALALPRRSAKLDRLMELLGEAVAGGHRVLVFSQFQQQLVAIEDEVKGRGWGSLRLDGKTRNRQSLVDKFQSSDGPPIFLISLKAGGYGLNLTAADIVIHFDPWWNPAAESQATDRAHRIGQTRPVTVYRLLTRGTVEEKVVQMQQRKREMAAMLDEAGGGDAAGWSEGELKALLAEA